MSSCVHPWENGVLTVGKNGKYFTNADKPFFWLGDTAWSLFRCLNEEQTYMYLKNRADKGYTVIQSVLIHTVGITRTKKGLPAPATLLEAISDMNEAYWRHVDKMIDIAQDLGIYMALLPTWGAAARDGVLNLDNVEQYADFIVKRYGNRPNIIWVLGGDIRGNLNYDLWNKFGKLLKEKNPGKLVGYHPFGRTSSSYWFSKAEWLDFHMYQSGHRRYDQRNLAVWDDEAAEEPWHGEDNWRYVEHDLALDPCHPVLDGEPSYEQIPQGIHNAGEPRWQDYHVRRYAWWSVLAGAAGHTYGHNAVFQFYGSVFAPPGCGVAETWDAAIHHPGAGQMTIVKDLATEIGWYECAPHKCVIDVGQKQGYVQAFGNDKNVLVYDWTGRSFALRDEGYTKADAYWVDPASGIRSYFGRVDISEGKVFTPPQKPNGQHNDWLLLLKNT